MAATKEQERKALARIKKIVEELGEDSYIGMAFEGCFEVAEENIENDFACSMKQRAEHAEMEAGKYKKMHEDTAADFEAADTPAGGKMITEEQARAQGADDIDIFLGICNEEIIPSSKPSHLEQLHGKIVGARTEPYHDVTVYEDGYEDWFYIGE